MSSDDIRKLMNTLDKLAEASAPSPGPAVYEIRYMENDAGYERPLFVKWTGNPADWQAFVAALTSVRGRDEYGSRPKFQVDQSSQPSAQVVTLNQLPPYATATPGKFFRRLYVHTYGTAD
jgi:hypothetical protein